MSDASASQAVTGSAPRPSVPEHLSDAALRLRQRIARELAERLKAHPQELRKRDAAFKLNAVTAPELYTGRIEEAESAWRGVLDLGRQGLVRITFLSRERRADVEPYMRSPRILAEPGSLERLARLGIVELGNRFWRQLCESQVAQRLLGPPRCEWLLDRPLGGLEDLDIEDAARQLAGLQDLALRASGLYLREVSAQVFQGRSKVLDGKSEWVTGFLGVPCPWPESPVQLPVSLGPGVLREVLFVENLTTFESLRANRAQYPGVALVYCCGFRGAAGRAGTGQLSLFFDLDADGLAPAPQLRRQVAQALQGGSQDLRLFFYGDLDFSGMEILGALRRTYPRLEAWRPGYGQLLSLLQLKDYGHLPKQAGKDGQVDPGATGCAYADEVLLPALRACGRMIDQECASGLLSPRQGYELRGG